MLSNGAKAGVAQTPRSSPAASAAPARQQNPCGLRRTSPPDPARLAAGGSSVQGRPVQGFTTVVEVVAGDVVGTTAVELVVEEVVVVELALVVVWAPAPLPAKRPIPTSSTIAPPAHAAAS